MATEYDKYYRCDFVSQMNELIDEYPILHGYLVDKLQYPIILGIGLNGDYDKQGYMPIAECGTNYQHWLDQAEYFDTEPLLEFDL